MSNAPIGIFDSGVGGLTVARAILDQLPNESTLYIGDTARGPYGPRPLAEVREFALETLDYLVDQGVKALVIACNTASAAMLRDARERYSVPVIEVIQPAVRRAVAATRTGRIGVLGLRQRLIQRRTSMHLPPPRILRLHPLLVQSLSSLSSVVRHQGRRLRRSHVNTLPL